MVLRTMECASRDEATAGHSCERGRVAMTGRPAANFSTKAFENPSSCEAVSQHPWCKSVDVISLSEEQEVGPKAKLGDLGHEIDPEAPIIANQKQLGARK
jgi:hypothetical protein